MATTNISHTRAAGFQRSAAGVATHAATSSPRQALPLVLTHEELRSHLCILNTATHAHAHLMSNSHRCISSSAAAAPASHGTCHAPCTPMRSSQLRQPAFTATQQRSCQRGTLQRRQAAGMDVMPAWTLDQIAGLVFGVRQGPSGIISYHS